MGEAAEGAGLVSGPVRRVRAGAGTGGCHPPSPLPTAHAGLGQPRHRSLALVTALLAGDRRELCVLPHGPGCGDVDARGSSCPHLCLRGPGALPPRAPRGPPRDTQACWLDQSCHCEVGGGGVPSCLPQGGAGDSVAIGPSMAPRAQGGGGRTLGDVAESLTPPPGCRPAARLQPGLCWHRPGVWAGVSEKGGGRGLGAPWQAELRVLLCPGAPEAPSTSY